MTLKGGTSQACAACKYQRKRCTPECLLAPHFRPEHTEVFKNAHKLFGVKNILKILKLVDTVHTTEAMRSIIYEANMRDRYPVQGCLGVIYQLQVQIKQSEKELYSVLSQLEFYKQHHHEITLSSSPMPADSPESQQLQLGINHPGLNLFQNHEVVNNHNQQFGPMTALPISYNGNENENIGNSNNNNNTDPKENMNNIIWDQQTYCYDDKSEPVSTQPLTIQEEVTHDYDEIYPFFDTIDDTQSYIGSKDANESSSESSLKESTLTSQLVDGNKLKNAQLQLGIVSEDYQTFA